MPPNAKLMLRRESLIREHIDSRNRQDYDATRLTFSAPRIEIVATNEIIDGADAVRTHYADTKTAFPDQQIDIVALYHADTVVIVECTQRGTHEGAFRGLPPTGREYAIRTAVFYVFDEEKLICERVYYDALAILAQLGVISDG